MNRHLRDVIETSRPSAAPLRPNEEGRQSTELGEGEQPRMRDMDTTSLALPRIADGAPRRDVSVDGAAVLDALTSAIAIVGADWRILTINRSWERIFGCTSADCVRRDFFAMFPFFSEDQSGSDLRSLDADGATRHFELERPTPDGLERYYVSAACSQDGQVVIEVSESRVVDIGAVSEHDAENASLRSLARQMAAVADAAELLDLLCRAASEQCEGTGAAVLRSSADEGEVVSAVGAMKLSLSRRFPLQGSVVTEALQTRGVVSVQNFTAAQRPLARIVPELRIGPLLAAPLIAHDRLLGVLAVVRDARAAAFSAREAQRLCVIADHAALAMWKAELLEQSRAADHAKGRFLATISHELRTPLTALTGYEELLADEVMGPLTEPQTDVLERMRSVTHHLTVMIEEVLAFSSIEAGREVARPTEFLADDLVRAVRAIVEPLARQKKLRVTCDLPGEPIRLTSDIDKVRQIIVNLAGNAVKFTDRGEVRIALSEVHSSGERGDGNREVRFAVHDTGPGIAADDARRLFRPFSQVDAGLTRRHGGTGLGLYISQRLALLLGGRIDVESELGVGSTFTLAIPAD